MGIPFVHYEVTEHDQARFVLGAARLAEIYFAAGAREAPGSKAANQSTKARRA
jgi:hypothetical protein